MEKGSRLEGRGQSQGRRRWRRLRVLTPLLAAVYLVLFGLPGEALAWGPSVHIWIGERILTTFGAALPLVALLLRQHIGAFLYGTIAPDFYVGKGSDAHDEHCHNWSAGKALLDGARTDDERAFAFGYLTHLAADIIGHNHFVPNRLYRTAGSKKLGHVYWEMHADNLLAEGYARMAAGLGRTEQPANDELLSRTLKRGIVPLGAKKRLFTAYLRVNGHRRARQIMDRLRPYSRRSLEHDDLDAQLELSLALALEALRNPDVPVLGKYDPIGARNLKLSKDIRRGARRLKAFSKAHTPFPIGPELRVYQEVVDQVPGPHVPSEPAEAMLALSGFAAEEPLAEV